METYLLFARTVANDWASLRERQNCDVFMLEALEVSEEMVRAERRTVSFAEHKSSRRSAEIEKALSSLASICICDWLKSGMGKIGDSPWRNMASSCLIARA